MVTSLDLVAEQLRVASGEPLSFTQDDIEKRGHSIEVRVNAENPATGFLPSPGRITRMRVPGGPGVRWDGGYGEGDEVSPSYDNLVGKLVVWAPDRERARLRMLRALGEFEIAGIATTIPAHVALLSHPDFAASTHSTKWVEDEVDAAVFAAPAAAPEAAGPDADPPAELIEQTVPVEVDGKRFTVKVWLPEGASGGGGAPRKRSARPRPSGAGAGGGAGSGTVSAPMQGTIIKVLVAEGDTVETGQAVVVLEAMKMENHINAETSGTVRAVRVAEGDTVGTGDVLVVVE
jgi:acetyl-CoA/propionyl-CoA carboxylase biotin carboxyl carrier protein